MDYRSHNHGTISLVLHEKCTRSQPLKSASSSLVYYGIIHYLRREFRIKISRENRYRTNCEAMSAISVFKCNLTRNSRVRLWIFLESHHWIKIGKPENSNNIVCFHPGRAPQKAISKSNVRTVIALANKEQRQSCTLEPPTSFIWTVFLHSVSNFLNKLHTI